MPRTGLHPLGGGMVSPYKTGDELIKSSIPGTYEVKFYPGSYDVVLTGGGGSGGTNCPSVTGGGAGASGGTIKGVLHIKNKVKAIVKVGRGGPSPAGQYWLNGISGDPTTIELNDNIIVKANAGPGAGGGGAGASAPPINTFDADFFVVKENIQGKAGENGNKYRQGFGGASTYNGYGKGADGGGLPGPAGVGGFISIVAA